MIRHRRSHEAASIKLPALLAVEGRDEQEFAEAMLLHLGLAGRVEVHDLGGVDEFPARLRALADTRGFGVVRALGVVRDAEQRAAESAFASIAGALVRAGLPAPAGLGFAAEGPPRVSVFILPDCRSAGMIEDLCLAAEEDYPAMPCVDAFLECTSHLPEPPRNASKARMGAFLASRSEFVREVGRAAQKGAFDLDHRAFEELKAFLRLLCDD